MNTHTFVLVFLCFFMRGIAQHTDPVVVSGGPALRPIDIVKAGASKDDYSNWNIKSFRITCLYVEDGVEYHLSEQSEGNSFSKRISDLFSKKSIAPILFELSEIVLLNFGEPGSPFNSSAISEKHLSTIKFIIKS